MNHPADTELTGMLHHAMPFTRTLGMEAIAANADEVRVRGTWSAERCTAAGILHGGYLMALADAAGATLASFNLRPRTHTSTIESKTNFIRPVTAGPVNVTASIVHSGQTTIVVQTDTHREDGKLVTRTTQTQAVLDNDRE
jgi:uncharacterized protein (TIGR00369 family)